jgi:hypothetical protein
MCKEFLKKVRNNPKNRIGLATYTTNHKTGEKTYYKSVSFSKPYILYVSEGIDPQGDPYDAYTTREWIVNYKEISKEEFDNTKKEYQ